MEGSRGLNFGESINNERVVRTDPAIMRGVLLAIPPRAPASTTCAHLGVFAGVDRPAVETIAFAEGVRGYSAPPHHTLCFFRPQCAGCLQRSSRTPVSA